MDNPKRFIIKRLSLSGLSVPKATIKFERGLNIIAGPSDTGKTFIAQCVNFMLGSDEQPEAIPESRGYGELSLEIETHDGIAYVLERSIDGGAFRLRSSDISTTLGPKHDAENEDTVSYFLLSLIGLDGHRRVRTNAKGKTRSLSFRDIAHLVVIGEEDVIKKRSPIHSGQYTTKTVENAVFRLILTGKDDSSLVAYEEPKVAKTKQQGKRELLDELLGRNEQELKKKNPSKLTADSILREMNLVEDRLASIHTSLARERESATNLEEHRERESQALQKTESKLIVLQELQLRFELLKKQYESDLERLEAIGEAGIRLAQMAEGRCPICGSDAEHHDREHQDFPEEPEAIANACSAEREKIQILLSDLSITISTNAEDVNRLEDLARTHRRRLADAQSALANELKPRLATLIEQVSDAEKHRMRLSHLSTLFQQRDELQYMLLRAQTPVSGTKNLPSNAMRADEVEDFCTAAETLLTDWKFPDLGRVTFSEKDQDLIISARKRSSHGKGVRALTYAAFTLALLRYCRTQKRPHPGLVLIDSPLVVYREPDSSEDGEEYRVKDSFFRGVASEFKGEQVIILENEDPPADLAEANIIRFTGADHGRSGFMPRV